MANLLIRHKNGNNPVFRFVLAFIKSTGINVHHHIRNQQGEK